MSKPSMLSEALTNKRLRLGESNVDPSQASIHRVAKAVFEAAAAADSSEEKKRIALKELARFELGPVRACEMVLKTCERETKNLAALREVLAASRAQVEANTSRLKLQVEAAKGLPRDEVEMLAKQCQELKPAPEANAIISEHKNSLRALHEERDALLAIVRDKRERLEAIKQLVKNL